MAFTIYSADLATAVNEMVSDTTLAFSPSAAVPVDKLAVLLVVWDNVNTANSDDTTILSVSDTKSNTWNRAAESQYTAGGVLDGMLNGIFYSIITTQIETTDTITITSTSNGTAKGATLCAFNRDTAKAVGVAGKGYERITASAAYSASVSGLTSEEHLWIGHNGMETDRTAVNTKDTTFTQISSGGLASWGPSGGSNTNVGGRGGYKIATDTGETYDNSGLSSQDRVTILVAFNESGGGGGGTVLDAFGMSGFFGA
jgi:hypothetical protein